MGNMQSKAQLLSAERFIGDMIPFSHHVSDNIIATRRGDYVTTIKFVGRGHISADREDVQRWVVDLNGLMRSIPTDKIEHLAFWAHVVRRKEPGYQDKQYDNVFCQSLNDKYNQKFSQQSTMMVNEIYLTICYRPIANKTAKLFTKFSKGSINERLDFQDSSLQALNGIADLIMSGTRPYEPQRLGVYTHSDRRFCSALEFYHYLLTHKQQRVPVAKERYYNYLCNKRISFAKHGEVGEIRGVSGEKFFAMLELKEYDDITAPGHFNILLKSDCELIITQSFSIVSKYAAKGFLQKHKKFLIDSEDVATSQVRDLDIALDDLISGKFVMGEHHMTVTTFDDTISDARNNLNALSSKLTEVGIIPTYLDLALESGFYSQLPCNFEHRPRPAVITSLNFWSFFSMHNHMTGKAKFNPWGDAISMFRSLSGSPYFFNFHKSKKDENCLGKKFDGNTMVLGKSGSGKTTLVCFLLAQAQSIKNLRLVVFDKDQGLSVFIRAIGGYYSPIKIGQPTGFNPFQLDDTDVNKKFIKNLIVTILNQDDYGVNYYDETELDKALEIIFRHDFENRNFTVFVQALPNPISEDANARPTVRQRLEKWVRGEYAWVFNNATDQLDFSKYLSYGFDVTEFLEMPDLRSVIVMYLTYRAQQLIDGNPFIYFFDEFWKLVKDPAFQNLFQNKLKTIRKENGICIFASQEANDALQSEIASTMVSQCATKIFLENPTASEEDYIDKLKLTHTEYEIVRSIPEKSYQFLVKQGSSDDEAGDEQSSLLQLDLSGFDKEMNVLSGTPDNAEEVVKIIKHVGSQEPADWLPHFYKHNGY